MASRRLPRLTGVHFTGVEKLPSRFALQIGGYGYSKTIRGRCDCDPKNLSFKGNVKTRRTDKGLTRLKTGLLGTDSSKF